MINYRVNPVLGAMNLSLASDAALLPPEVMVFPWLFPVSYENLICQLENAPSLKLTLTGWCVAVPANREVINFTTYVRNKVL